MGSSTSSNTNIAVDKDFPHPVYVKCDSESLKLTEMEQNYEFIFGGNLDASIKDAKKTRQKEGPSDSSDENAEGKVNFESRQQEHQTFFSKEIQTGFTMIMPGEFLLYKVAIQNTDTVYITIFANQHGGKYIHPLCVNLPTGTSDNILVKGNGQVVQSEYKDPFKMAKCEYQPRDPKFHRDPSNTYVAVDGDFRLPVYVRCDSESLKLTEMEQNYEFIFGGSLDASIKVASKTKQKEGPSDSSDENAEGSKTKQKEGPSDSIDENAEGSKTEEKEGPSDSSDENVEGSKTEENEGPEESAEGKVNFESRTKEHSKFCAKLIQIGFTRIVPGEFLLYKVPIQNTHTVYITIYANHHGGKYIHPLCVNLPKNIDDMMLVKRNGQVVQSIHGNPFQQLDYLEFSYARPNIELGIIAHAFIELKGCTSKTFVAVDKDFSHHVYVKCDSESLKLTEMVQNYELIFGGDLDASTTEANEGPSDSSEENAEGKVNFESRTKQHSKFCAKLIQIGFTRIVPGEFLLFNIPVQGTDTVYITIYANHHGGKYIHPLCVNFPTGTSDNILVKWNGQVVQPSDKNPFKMKKYNEGKCKIM